MSYLKTQKNVFHLYYLVRYSNHSTYVLQFLGGKRPAIRGEVPNFPAVLALLLIFIMIYWGYNFVLKHLLIGIVIFLYFLFKFGKQPT